MKNSFIAVSLGIALLAAAVPVPGSEQANPEALIGRVRAVLQTPRPPEHGIAKALGDALDAALLVLPKAGYEAEFRSLVGGARRAVEEGGMLSDGVYRDLLKSYRLVSGGKDWTVPAELKAAGEPGKGIELAVKICNRLLDSSLAAYKAGRGEEAASDLIGLVLLVVTPIEASR